MQRPGRRWRRVAGGLPTVRVFGAYPGRAGGWGTTWELGGADGGERGRAKRLTVSATMRSLSARGLSEIEVSVPSDRHLDLVARLIEASEVACDSAIEAAQLRHWQLRDSLIQEIAGSFRGAK